jgi:hypothetical protein
MDPKEMQCSNRRARPWKRVLEFSTRRLAYTYTICQDLRMREVLLHTMYFYYPPYQLQNEGVMQECDSEGRL